MDEMTAIQSVRTGDLTAFEWFIVTYQQPAYYLAYRIVGDAATAQDAVQEAFVAVYRKFHLFRDGSFKSWLMRIVINQCYDELRRRKRAGTYGLWHSADESFEIFSSNRSAVEREPETMTQQAELAALLQTGIRALPRSQRVTVVLRDVHELSYEEIAATTQTNLGTVKSRLNRGRHRLRRFLQARAEHLLADHLPTVYPGSSGCVTQDGSLKALKSMPSDANSYCR